MDRDRRSRVPRTDAVLGDARLAAAARELGRDLVRGVVTRTLERVRDGELPPERAADAALAALPPTAASLHAVLNATGVLVHTNLGRAPLSAAARAAVDAAAGCTDVELDLATGRRGPRGTGALAALAEAVPAAGGVHVVNNNAAALVLAATALARGREIVVSRGEMVEIGDGFRLPDLLASTGARLREVGTTNRTHRADYAAAVGPDTGFVLKVHPSNFATVGFVADTPVRELATLDVPVVYDIGSGLLRPHPALPREPDAAGALADGAALVTASADKLLGGPQAGLLLGDADLVARLRRHPLARALRVDKLTLAALEATLRGPEPPVPAALGLAGPALVARAEALAARLCAAGVPAEAVPSQARVGGGGAPEVELPGAAVAVARALAAPLRNGRPAVVGRVHAGRLLLDLRTVPAGDDERLAGAVRAAAARTPRTATAPDTDDGQG
ncbi:L-seryl-tRNA(Sec) selenium transferase [Streptomyces sp. DSM 42041]|uniref:L-seryl-tRNA(Sec) selenium transferase n=1 Tax=Streptomyces hazeniae TaxID=3075538 RepID=A0ABU2NKK2_9ACTN|nr:L-seryl-tRNA(Sec) selenium transferase [Streptomyces sp. DSM 42041]MDT0377521.1 L-seryl-tRNA(Sec) selenium transferase [Streptomyces sp. DSM 42041]